MITVFYLHASNFDPYYTAYFFLSKNIGEFHMAITIGFRPWNHRYFKNMYFGRKYLCQWTPRKHKGRWTWIFQ